MPPKRGRKRKRGGALDSSNGDSGEPPLSPPDRATWPGWVEMESEPAFFNVMLQEMGVCGVKIQEVLGLDQEMLAILPRPIHALIFLFRYKDTDQADQREVAECPNHIWFANQIPDFACASVALLNIVNNIKGLEIGKELRDFRALTLDMDPISRGDAIDSFDFVKRIHNSFARETDLLIADMHLKQKAAKARKRQALSKARETREANKAGQTPLMKKDKPLNSVAAPTRLSERKFTTPQKLTGSVSRFSRESSPLSDPPNSDPEFKAGAKLEASATIQSEETRRRSKRKSKPRQTPAASQIVSEEEDAEGFHFVAYMPIQGHVWKLDGLDSFPQDMGAFDSSVAKDWIDIAQPALQARMAAYEGADIEFNLMAVVRDSTLNDRNELLRNVKQLQMIDKTLDGVSPNWRDSHETSSDVITGISPDLGVSQMDIDSSNPPADVLESITGEKNVTKLVEHREQIVADQASLRGLVRDGLEGTRLDKEKARHRRQGYGAFVRAWLGALAEHEILSSLLEVEDT